MLEWAVIAVISFAVIMALYGFGVRRWNVMRFLCGMKLLKQTAPVITHPVQPATGKV